MSGRSLRRVGVRVGCLVVASGVALGLVGCSPAIRGAVGITVTPDGEIRALLEPCGNHLKAATLYTTDGDWIDDTYGDWTIADEDSRSGDAAAIAIPPLDATQSYEFRAWTEPATPNYPDYEYRLESVEFTTADLASLPVGMVRWQQGPTSKFAVETTAEKFHEDACTNYYGRLTPTPTPTP